jgi:hypothetical protein
MKREQQENLQVPGGRDVRIEIDFRRPVFWFVILGTIALVVFDFCLALF